MPDLTGASTPIDIAPGGYQLRAPGLVGTHVLGGDPPRAPGGVDLADVNAQLPGQFSRRGRRQHRRSPRRFTDPGVGVGGGRGYRRDRRARCRGP